MRSSLPARAVFSGALLVAAIGMFAVATGPSIRGMCVVTLTLAASWLPGIAIARALLPPGEPPLALVVWGALLGLTSFRLAMVATTVAIGADPASVLLAMACVITLGFLARRFGKRQHPRWPEEERQEACRLLVLLAVALAVTIPPYWGLARLTARGHAFVPYFNNDLLGHMSIAAEVARAIPPENPYFAGHPLHYYWLHHVWPAAVVRLGGLPAMEALKLTNVVTMLVFVGVLFAFMRRYVAEPLPRAFAISTGLFAYSYIGLLFLASVVLPGFTKRVLLTHLGSVPSLLSHSWFRDFLYEAHAVTALSLVMFAGYLAHREEAAKSSAGQCAGVAALAVALATDVFVGGIGMLWYAIVMGRLLRRRAVLWRHAIISGLAGVGLLLAFVRLDIFPLGARVVSLHPHSALRVAPLYLLLDLGPLFLFGLAGVVLVLGRGRDTMHRDHVVLIGVALLIGFALMVESNPNFALRKAIKVVQVPLVVMTGVAFMWLWSVSGRRWHRPVVLGVALLGTVTLGTDVYQHANINRELGQDLPATYVSSSEMRALEWIRMKTAQATVFQSVSEVRPGRRYYDTFYTLISALGERRTLLGNYQKPWELQVARASIDQRMADLEGLFGAGDGETLREMLKRLRPDYLWVDTREPAPSKALRELAGCGQLREVLRDGPIQVLRVEPGGCPGRVSPEVEHQQPVAHPAPHPEHRTAVLPAGGQLDRARPLTPHAHHHR